MKTKTDDQAYPCFHGDAFKPQIGLTKREIFAAMAMQGLMSNIDPENYRDYIAENSVRIADALINKLNKE